MKTSVSTVSTVFGKNNFCFILQKFAIFVHTFFSVNKLWIFLLYLLFFFTLVPSFPFCHGKWAEKKKEWKNKNERTKEWKVHSQEWENTTAKNTLPLPCLLHNLCTLFHSPIIILLLPLPTGNVFIYSNSLPISSIGLYIFTFSY